MGWNVVSQALEQQRVAKSRNGTHAVRDPSFAAADALPLPGTPSNFAHSTAFLLEVTAASELRRKRKTRLLSRSQLASLLQEELRGFLQCWQVYFPNSKVDVVLDEKAGVVPLAVLGDVRASL